MSIPDPRLGVAVLGSPTMVEYVLPTMTDGHAGDHGHGGERVHDGADFVWRSDAVSRVLALRDRALPAHDAVAFAIPGKPVGAHTVATLVMRPFFTGEAGPPPAVEATLARDVGLGPEGFEYVVPVTLDRAGSTVPAHDDGEWGANPPGAMPLGHVDSPLGVYEDTFDPSVLSSSTRATRADGFVVTERPLEAGERVRVHPYPAVER